MNPINWNWPKDMYVTQNSWVTLGLCAWLGLCYRTMRHLTAGERGHCGFRSAVETARKKHCLPEPLEFVGGCELRVPEGILVTKKENSRFLQYFTAFSCMSCIFDKNICIGTW